jgi:hypothetical protein
MAEPVPPPLFGSAIARQCTRWLGDRNCAAAPVMHVAWVIDDDGIEAGFVCASHVDELGSFWIYAQADPRGEHLPLPR